MWLTWIWTHLAYIWKLEKGEYFPYAGSVDVTFMLCTWRMRNHMDTLAGMHLTWLFLGEMECSVTVSCFLFRVAESCSIFVLFPDVLASQILLLWLENWLHLVLHMCCIPIPTEMEMSKYSTIHLSSKVGKIFTLEDFLLERALEGLWMSQVDIT